MAAAPFIIQAAMAAAQTMSSMQKQRAEAREASEQADYLRSLAAVERAQAQQNADSLHLQRDMEKSAERRTYEEQMARARVGGASAESLLAGADSYSLDASHKDWLTGQQAQNILNTGALRSLHFANQSALYGVRGKNLKRDMDLTMLQGGANMFSSMYGAGSNGAMSYGSAAGSGSYGASSHA